MKSIPAAIHASRLGLLLAFAVLVLAACVHHVHVVQPAPDLAMLELGKKGGTVDVESFDGKPIEAEGTVRELHFSPGRHTVEGHVLSNGLSTPFSITQDFGPGSHYRVSAKQTKGYDVEAILERVGSTPR